MDTIEASPACQGGKGRSGAGENAPTKACRCPTSSTSKKRDGRVGRLVDKKHTDSRWVAGSHAATSTVEQR